MNQKITKHILGKLPSMFFETVDHPHFAAASREILELIENPGPVRLLFVPGPTGVGKTALASSVTNHITEQYKHELSNDPDRMLYGFCSIKAPGPYAFSWKDTYSELLRSLAYPFTNPATIAHLWSDRKQQMELPQFASPQVSMRTSTDRLFRVLQHVIEVRRPKMIVMDEAHHFARVKTVESLRHQLEHLKYLADETRTLFVLFSTYELIDLIGANGQLIRRSHTIPFHRYIYRREESDPRLSVEGFAHALNGYQNKLGGECEYEFLENVSYFYQGTIGCVGLLRDWLGRAWTLATRSDRKINKSILDRTQLSVRTLNKLLDEAEAGEKLCDGENVQNEQFWDRLGLTRQIDASKPTAIIEPLKKRQARLLPGHRAPHSDPIGVAHILGKKRSYA